MKPYIKRLMERLPYVKFSENSKKIPPPELTSYSVNKGEKIVMCMNDPKTQLTHDYNTLMYVALHEAAHVACPERGHTPRFRCIQKYLVDKAKILGIYKDIDYKTNPQPYCGIMIREDLDDIEKCHK